MAGELNTNQSGSASAAKLAAILAGYGLTLRDDKFTVTGSADATKTLKFELDGMVTGADLILSAGAQTADRSISLPVLTADDTLMTLGTAQTVSGLKTHTNGLTVLAGTTAVQALTATTGAFTGLQTIDFGTGALPALTVTAGWLRVANADNVNTGICAETWGAPAFFMEGRRSGGTRSAPAATGASESILLFRAYGHNGTSYTTNRSAEYIIRANSLWSGTNQETAHVWSGTPNGSTTTATWMTLAGTGLTLASALSSGLTIAATSGTTLTVSSTNGAAISCAGGATLTGKISLNTSYAWDVAAYRSVQLGLYGATYGSTAGTNGYITGAYHNGTNWLYAVSFAVAQYEQNVNDGSHIWRQAAAGTAGNTVSLLDRMKLESNGSLVLKSASLDRTVGGLAYTATATATVANTTTETTIIGSGTGTKTLPANFLTAGRTIRVRVRGILSDTGTPTLQIRVKMGSTTLVDTGTFTLSGTITNNQFDMECATVCRSTGVSGTVMASGLFHYDSSSGGSTEGMGVTAAVTVDTTASQVLDVTAQWGTASASNTISGQTCTVEIVN